VGWGVEGDAQPDLDVPAGDADLFDDESQQLLPLVEVETVERVEGAAREVGDALAQLVVAGELGALLREGVTLVGQLGAAGVDVFGAAPQFDELDQPGLVEVDQAPALVVAASSLRSKRAS
jgi:hypothetical protein